MTIYFTADLHLDHFNIIRYCNRPFTTAWEMSAEIIKRWNSVVKSEDTVYVLGDVMFCSPARGHQLISQLQGEKHLIRGNHDRRHSDARWLNFGFKTIKITDTLPGHPNILMHHYPYRDDLEFEQKHVDERLEDKGSWLLHGHIHERRKFKNKMINVGVDCWDFFPVSLETILGIVNGG